MLKKDVYDLWINPHVHLILKIVITTQDKGKIMDLKRRICIDQKLFECTTKCLCCFVAGEYRVGIKFNDQHIPDSPYKLFISPAMGDAHKLEVFQFPNSGVQADKPAAFLVRKNGAKGELDAKVIFYHHLRKIYQFWLNNCFWLFIANEISLFTWCGEKWEYRSVLKAIK